MTTLHPINSDDLNAYLDNDLDPVRRVEVDAALANDPVLRAELADLRAIAGLVAGLPDYLPRRSFQLGEEHRRPETLPTPIRQPSNVVRLLPLVRQLSVAATLVFMVVAGALYFDMNGNVGGDEPGVTESTGGASQDAEDAAAGDSGEILTDRGDAASVGDDPMADLTQLVPEDGDDLVAQAGDPGSAGIGMTSVSGNDADRSAWIWVTAGLGVVAVALAGLWYALARGGRQSGARES